MTDRDHFAAAALTGLLAQGDDGSFSEESYVRSAYRWADAMLRERERTNHDAAPAARAQVDAAGISRQGTGDTPVTEPMPKEKLAEVSDGWRRDIRPPDAADRALAAACDKAWGIAAEPVAWGVVDDRGLQLALHPTPEHASYYARNFGSGLAAVVPLYRHPQPTLTAGERASIMRAIETLKGAEYIEAFSTENDATAAATLRGLLERLK